MKWRQDRADAPLDEVEAPRRRRRWIVAAVLAPVGIAAGLGAVAWGEHAVRGDGGISATPAPSSSTTTTAVAAPSPSQPPATVAPTTATRPTSTKPAVVTVGHSVTRAPAPPPPPPPAVPGGPSVSLSQGADCIQVGDTNHVESNVSAPAGLGNLNLQVVHSTDGTTYNGPMDFDGSTYSSDVGPFNDYPDAQTVRWTVTVTDTFGRTAQDSRQFTVSEDPCP